MGVVRGAHGVRGELKVELFDPQSRSLSPGVAVKLGPLATRVSSVRPARKGLIVGLEGVESREQAAALLGRALAVARAELPAPGEGEHYLADLVGYAAVGRGGELLGTIAGELAGSPQPILVLETGEGEAWVPAVPGILIAVDPEARRVILDPPEGLLELYRK